MAFNYDGTAVDPYFGFWSVHYLYLRSLYSYPSLSSDNELRTSETAY